MMHPPDKFLIVRGLGADKGWLLKDVFQGCIEGEYCTLCIQNRLNITALIFIQVIKIFMFHSVLCRKVWFFSLIISY